MLTSEKIVKQESDQTSDANHSKRNYGIDLLRVVSMLYVVILHTLGQGGVLNAAKNGSIQYHVGWFMEVWAYGAVDIFALISGYVAYSPNAKKTNYSKIITLWFQVIFYSLGVALVYRLLDPELVPISQIVRLSFPFTNGLYWYFTAYIGLFLVMPVLNAGIQRCSEQLLSKLFVLIILVVTVSNLCGSHFTLNSGYSAMWLIFLYILGASMKKCSIGEHVKWYQAILGILLCTVIAWAWKMHGVKVELTSKITISKSMFVSYTSPTVLIAAIFHVILFSKLRFKNLSQKIIAFMGAGSFSVYILNCQKCIWNYFIKKRFSYLGKGNPVVLIIHTLAFSLAFVICSVLIDFVRRWLFEGFQVNRIADRIVAIVDKVISFPLARKRAREEEA